MLTLIWLLLRILGGFKRGGRWYFLALILLVRLFLIVVWIDDLLLLQVIKQDQASWGIVLNYPIWRPLLECQSALVGVCCGELLGVKGRGQYSVIIDVDRGAQLVVHTRACLLLRHVIKHILSKGPQIWLLSELYLKWGVPVLIINDLWRKILALVIIINF